MSRPRKRPRACLRMPTKPSRPKTWKRRSRRNSAAGHRGSSMKDGGGFGGENRSAPTPARLTNPFLPPPPSASRDLGVLPGPPGPGLISQHELTRKIRDYDPKADTALID